jgi:hypothetical protein
VLIFPWQHWQGKIPSLSHIEQWLKAHDLEQLSASEFDEALFSLNLETLAIELVQKAKITPWLPKLLAELIRKKQVILLGSTAQELAAWWDILWHYTPDFLRSNIEWSNYAWSLRTDHEAIITKIGALEPPKPLPFWQKLFSDDPSRDTDFCFDVSQALPSYNLDQRPLPALEWLCCELIQAQPWPDWSLTEQQRFLHHSLQTLSDNPKVKPKELLKGYPTSSKLKEFVVYLK